MAWRGVGGEHHTVEAPGKYLNPYTSRLTLRARLEANESQRVATQQQVDESEGPQELTWQENWKPEELGRVKRLRPHIRPHNKEEPEHGILRGSH